MQFISQAADTGVRGSGTIAVMYLQSSSGPAYKCTTVNRDMGTCDVCRCRACEEQSCTSRVRHQVMRGIRAARNDSPIPAMSLGCPARPERHAISEHDNVRLRLMLRTHWHTGGHALLSVRFVSEGSHLGWEDTIDERVVSMPHL